MVPSQPDEMTESAHSPRHGDQGDRADPPPCVAIPVAPAVAVSRESGARGGTIGRRVARRLGWQAYDRELLQYLAQETPGGMGLVDGLTPAASEWVEDRLARLLREQQLSQNPSVISLARTMLRLSAGGRCVLIGSGAGCVLPRHATLNVRLVAPWPERVAYMGQWLRLSGEEAAEKVRQRDESRANFLSAHFHRQPSDVHQYDLVLNSAFLGEDLCAELIARAALERANAVAVGRRPD